MSGALEVYSPLMVLLFVGNEFWTFTFIGRFWELLFRPQADMTRQICALITTPYQTVIWGTQMQIAKLSDEWKISNPVIIHVPQI